jgi:hypothetical protein
LILAGSDLEAEELEPVEIDCGELTDETESEIRTQAETDKEFGYGRGTEFPLYRQGEEGKPQVANGN